MNVQLLDMFGSLLERPLVAADAQDRYPLLVSALDQEVEGCKIIYNQRVQTAEGDGTASNSSFTKNNNAKLRTGACSQGRVCSNID